MRYDTEAFAGGDSGSTIATRLLLNDSVNKQVDDNAVIAAGLARGTVVAWSAANNRWEALNGTLALTGTEVIGIVEELASTSPVAPAQVRTGGVYTDGTLAANTAYYVQADGTLGTTATEVAFGRTTSAGNLIPPFTGGSGGGGGSVNPLAEQTFTYDTAGKLATAVIDGTTYTITYDAQERLDTISDGSKTMTCVYNAYGQFTGTTVA